MSRPVSSSGRSAGQVSSPGVQQQQQRQSQQQQQQDNVQPPNARLLALDILRMVPHENIVAHMAHYPRTQPASTAAMSKISMTITRTRNNAFDVISERMLSAELPVAELMILMNFAISMAKSFPTSAALVMESHEDGELWHKLNDQGMEERWVICVTRGRARRLEKNNTIRLGVYSMSVSETMKDDAKNGRMHFAKLFHCFYGIDRRPVFMGEVVPVKSKEDAVVFGSGVTTLLQSSASKVDRARIKDTQERSARNAKHFQLVHPSGQAYHVPEDKAPLMEVFIGKLLELERYESAFDRNSIQFMDPVHGQITVRMSYLQASHNVGVPFPLIPKQTWQLEEVLSPEGSVINPATLLASLKSADVREGEQEAPGSPLSSSKKKARQRRRQFFSGTQLGE